MLLHTWFKKKENTMVIKVLCLATGFLFRVQWRFDALVVIERQQILIHLDLGHPQSTCLILRNARCESQSSVNAKRCI